MQGDITSRNDAPVGQATPLPRSRPSAFFAPELTTDPLRRPSLSWKFSLFLAKTGIGACTFGAIQVLIGMQAATIASSNKEVVLALVTGLGALIGALTRPFIGALSDRTTSQYGRRVPWVIGGVLLGAAGMILMSTAHSVATMVIYWCITQAGINTASAVMKALPNDSVKEQHRGAMGGWLGAGSDMGSLVGVAFAAMLTSLIAGWVACAIFLIIAVLPYLLRAEDRRLPEKRPFPGWGRYLKSFLISPIKYHDYSRIWWSAFLVWLAFSFVLVYLFYYLQDLVQHPNPSQAILIITGVYTVCSLLSAFTFGLAADYMQKYRGLLFLGAALMAAGMLTMALIHTFATTIGAAMLIGIGHGCYAALHYTIATFTIPPTDDTARDFGVLNIAWEGPQAIAALVAIPILTAYHTQMAYLMMFSISAALFLLGGFIALRIRSVK